MSAGAGSDSSSDRSVERLFVALPLPERLAAPLAALQPAAAEGVRPTAPADLHVTLHFLGQAPAAAAVPALAAVDFPAFPVRLSAAGHFALAGGRTILLAGGRTILWVGAEPTAPLLELHARAGAALAAVGFAPETRPYVPHLTLARLGPAADPGIVASFERQTLPLAAREFHCGQFALYASVTAPAAARYRVLKRFALRSTG